jgi:secreted PhoX family phosphatase
MFRGYEADDPTREQVDIQLQARVQALHQRHLLPQGASERKWERYHDRFDLAKEPHEPFRFGWVAEIDPTTPASPRAGAPPSAGSSTRGDHHPHP